MDQGDAAQREGLSRSVLVLGGATPDSIGAGICRRLTDLGNLAFAPSQAVVDVMEPDWTDLYEVMDECKPDSVVYAVGVNELQWSSHLTRESWDRLMATNVWGFINVLQALQHHESDRAFNVLALTSDAGRRPMRTSIAYCASKAALDMTIRVAARELSGAGWRVNGLAPGKVAGTAMTRYVDSVVPGLRGWTPEYAEAYERSSSAVGRPLTVEEVAVVACDVLLSESLVWTGDIVTVNGAR